MNLSDINMDEIESEETKQTEIKIADGRSIEEILNDDVNIITTKMELATIKTDEDFTGAAEWLKENKTLQKKVVSHFEDDRKRTHEAYKAITTKIKDMTDLLKKGEAIVKTKLSDYQKELDRKKRIEEERIRKEQDKIRREAEEKERLRIEKLEAEALAKREALAKEKKVPVEEIEIEEIPEPEPENQIDLFEAPAPTTTIKAPETKGVTFAKVWKWELEDISKVPAEFLILDEKKINGLVRAMKGDSKISGIRVYEDNQVRA